MNNEFHNAIMLGFGTSKLEVLYFQAQRCSKIFSIRLNEPKIKVYPGKVNETIPKLINYKLTATMGSTLTYFVETSTFLIGFIFQIASELYKLLAIQ